MAALSKSGFCVVHGIVRMFFSRVRTNGNRSCRRDDGPIFSHQPPRHSHEKAEDAGRAVGNANIEPLAGGRCVANFTLGETRCRRRTLHIHPRESRYAAPTVAFPPSPVTPSLKCES